MNILTLARSNGTLALLVMALLRPGLEAAVAQPAPIGLEFEVDRGTIAPSRFPQVAAGGDGQFVVIWHNPYGESSLHGQLFDRSGRPRGRRLGVTSDEGVSDWRVGMDGHGDMVVIWRDVRDGGTSGQRLDKAGIPRGSSFRVTTDSYYSHALAMGALGDFVVAWSNEEAELHVERYDHDGEVVGSVSIPSAYGPALATNADGSFVVVWSRYDFVSSYDLVGQRFDGAGNHLGGEFQVNTYRTSGQYLPEVASAADGSFVVVWRSFGQDGDGPGVFGQRFDPAGTPVGAEFQVNTRTAGVQAGADLAMGADGSFVAVWTSDLEDPSTRSVFGQWFDRRGRRVGGEFAVSGRSDRSQSGASAAIGSDGDLVVAWHRQSSAADRLSSSIVARRWTVVGGGSGGGGGDVDGDGIDDGVDNCPTIVNPAQTDDAGDGYGDDCVSPDVILPPTSRFGARPVIGRGTLVLDGVTFGDDANVGEYVRLDRGVAAGDQVTIGDLVVIGRRSTLGDEVAIGFATRIEGGVRIGSRVVIGDQVVIKRNAAIEDGARVDALAVLFAGVRIGKGATIEMGARIGRGAVVAAGATVPAGTTVPAGSTFE